MENKPIPTTDSRPQPVFDRPHNPLYDGKTDNLNYDNITRRFLNLIAIGLLICIFYLFSQDTPTPRPTRRDIWLDSNSNGTYTINPLVFGQQKADSSRRQTLVISSTDSIIFIPSETKTTHFDDLSSPAYGKTTTPAYDKTATSAYGKTAADTVSNLVFAGSFEHKENAELLLKHLKSIGYEKSEIVMKQDLPFMVVVSGFHASAKVAMNEVRALKKRGIDVYKATENLKEIYRQAKN